MNLFSPCVFGHARDWHTIRVEGVLHRQCARCLKVLGAVLVNAEAPEIVAPKLPAIKALKATRAKRRPKVLRYPRRQA